MEYAAARRGQRAQGRSRHGIPGALAALLLACGPATGTEAPAGSSDAVVQIVDYTFVPPRITVAPGSAVLFLNLDGFQHAIATEAAAGSHVTAAAGGVSFETPPFTGSMTVTVPATAAPGTVIPFFCWLHPGASVGDGEIVVAAP